MNDPRQLELFPERPAKVAAIGKVHPLLQRIAACHPDAVPYCLGMRRERGLVSFLRSLPLAAPSPGTHLAELWNYAGYFDACRALWYTEQAGLIRRGERNLSTVLTMALQGDWAMGPAPIAFVWHATPLLLSELEKSHAEV